ncbi:MAG: SIS domain-containing protein [Candidatus Thorarchaeota archaeon]
MSKFLDQYYQTIKSQEHTIPRVLRKNIDDEIKKRFIEARRLIFTGCGDSYGVAQFGEWALQSIGIPSAAISPTEIEQVYLGNDGMLVAVTASGRSIETLRAMRHAKSRGTPVVLLTDAEHSPASEIADYVLRTDSGVATYDLPPSVTTTSAIALLLALISDSDPDISGLVGDLLQLTSKFGTAMRWSETEGRKIGEVLTQDGVMFIVSEGANYVSAQVGAMKFSEMSLVRSVVGLTEEFRHHQVLSLQCGDRVILIGNRFQNPSDDVFMSVVASLGARPIYVNCARATGIGFPLVQVIPHIIALQMAAYHGASMSEPDLKGFRKPHADAFKIYV